MKSRRFTAILLAGALALSGTAALPAAYSPLMTAVSAEEAEKLPPPEEIKAAPADSSIKISWSAVEGAYGYRIYIFDEASGKFKIYKNVKGTVCTVKGLKSSTEYKFRLAAAVRKDGRTETQTRTGDILISTCSEGSFTSDRAPSHLNNDFIEKAGGKGHKTVLKKCGIGNYSYDAESRCADGYVMYAEIESELLLYFNENDELTNFLLIIPSEKDLFDKFSKSLVQEGYDKYFNDELGTDVYQQTSGRDLITYFYDEESNSMIMVYVFLDHYGK